MSEITIHDLDEALTSRLRVQADGHGRSMEDEARDILRLALGGKPEARGGLAASIRARFAAMGGVEMPAVERDAMRVPPSFGE